MTALFGLGMAIGTSFESRWVQTSGGTLLMATEALKSQRGPFSFGSDYGCWSQGLLLLYRRQ